MINLEKNTTYQEDFEQKMNRSEIYIMLRFINRMGENIENYTFFVECTVLGLDMFIEVSYSQLLNSLTQRSCEKGQIYNVDYMKIDKETKRFYFELI